jgi:transcriptional regulator with XRE-family HTH domain
VRRPHAYSLPALDAARVLGAQIAQGRRLRRFSQADLCERASVSRDTLRKAEKGDPSTALGIMFELATLVGVNLFGVPPEQLPPLVARERDRLALLPAHVYPQRDDEDDDF